MLETFVKIVHSYYLRQEQSIYLKKSAGNFSFNIIAKAVTKNIYNKYIHLPKKPEHV